MNTLKNWITIAESNFAHEREALDFIRQQFPNSDRYRAWSNFEFIAPDGSINEVDLLVFTPQGLFLIEIKSRPGVLSGDAGTWIWENNGKIFTRDNPIKLTNLKAKRLRSLLASQRAYKGGKSVPYIDALVFLSAEKLQLQLSAESRYRLCLRDRPPSEDQSERSGIMAAILSRDCLGLRASNFVYGRPHLKLVSQAMEQAGIRPSQKSRRVSDYILGDVIAEGLRYQDWSAKHAQVENNTRRIRFYLVRKEASKEDREIIERAAKREFQLLESLQHPGIIRAYGLSEHELGPALTLEHHAGEIRLDHYLAQRSQPLEIDASLDLIRQIAEAIRFAHGQRVIHRGLTPKSILLIESKNGSLKIKISNWQLGYRAGSSLAGANHEVTATSHIDRLVEDADTAFLPPEALNDSDFIGEHLDIFSLGAIAFFLFTGQPPAANGFELTQKLRETNGLQISSVLNGTPESLQDLILESTRPNVDDRIETVADFLALLDEVEQALTEPEHVLVDNPNEAQQGDILEGNFEILKRLGQGACSIVFLVSQGEHEYVLKVANDPEHNERLQKEGEVLSSLRHSHIVDFQGVVQVGNRYGLLLQPVLVDREKRRIETLGQRLRKEGPLRIDMLQRFGEDLLGVVNFLDEQGEKHRDIKPDNIVIGQVGRGDKLHLVLFDFSLSGTPLDNIKAGTTGYLDPLLGLRQPPQWDLYAERYAAAATLYEMATGTLPIWGDGVSDPSFLDCEITLEPERFDVALRESLTSFFETAFRRQIEARFDNSEEMLWAWRQCFEGIEEPGAFLETEDEADLESRLAEVTFETTILELGLGSRALNALDLINVLSVKNLLKMPPRKLQRLRGVGNKTRREILAVTKVLRKRLGTPTLSDFGGETSESDLGLLEATGRWSVDRLLQKVTKPTSDNSEVAAQVLEIMLGLKVEWVDVWPNPTTVALRLKQRQKQIESLWTKFQRRWAKTPAITNLREDVLKIVQQSSGVMELEELALALLIDRGALTADPQLRIQQAKALVRIAVEVEGTLVNPKFVARRVAARVLIGLDKDWIAYGCRLAEQADQLAQADPLVSPERAIEMLQEIEVPGEGGPLPERRLLQAAAAVAQNAALSSRQELYPRGMEAERALRLSQGALYGVQSLTVQQVKDRISGRYPEAEDLPARPALDGLLQQFIPALVWDAARGVYMNQVQDFSSLSSSTSFARVQTGAFSNTGQEMTVEEADARVLEERLQRGIQDGSFLALLVNPKRYQRAKEEICSRFPVQVVDFEAMLLNALRQVADQARVNWELVVQTDAKPHQGDWDKLMLLVGRAMPLVEAELLKAKQTILMIYPGLLARYDQITMLERLREKVGRDDGIPGLWLLLPNEQQATIDGQAVPLLSPGQRAKITEAWLANRHRAELSSQVDFQS
ncbi:BREX system serine/threonine kinase PglW [Lyngbya confervoides]|uniref:BREX system serine/threonine kinase PglW n=1 Tax=Lyngbya confervoides BDU141951 TaxID=1574623 RepID=A0ABD4T807_9CYAN|nr:BREX system serine/threonine kinase PglW [Lyngbya confervoides]MCM1984645.1 BREX system serine/threonine kinase PglW [Lyngbya confervoides BDU141951]